jgi:hypothetical protein
MAPLPRLPAHFVDTGAALHRQQAWASPAVRALAVPTLEAAWYLPPLAVGCWQHGSRLPLCSLYPLRPATGPQSGTMWMAVGHSHIMQPARTGAPSHSKTDEYSRIATLWRPVLKRTQSMHVARADSPCGARDSRGRGMHQLANCCITQRTPRRILACCRKQAASW